MGEVSFDKRVRIARMKRASEEIDKDIQEFADRFPKLAKAFENVELNQYKLFAKKCVDYGIENIAVGTELASDEERMFALQGIWFRMMDKMNRWKNLTSTGADPKNESLQDTFEDLANYAMIANLVYNNQWKNG